MRGRWPWGVVRGLIATLALGLLFALRPADAALADPAAAAAFDAQLSASAKRAAAALQQVTDRLHEGLDLARRGAAATVQGDDPPGPQLIAAAEELDAAGAVFGDARATVTTLGGLLTILQAPQPPTLDLTEDEVQSAAVQLRAAADAADAFAAMRHASSDVLDHLRAALVAVNAGDPRAALAAARSGEAQLDAVRGWQGRLDTLSVWVTTTERLLDALEQLAQAQIDDDAAAARAARAAYAAAAANAAQADRAREIAISEGGGDVSAAALAATAHAVEQADITAAAVTAVVRRVHS